MKSLPIPLFLVAFMFSTVMLSQSVIMSETNEPYLYPWVGGMDAMQFNEVDMNLDGIDDIIAFDRRGNRKLCFINNGISDSVSYSFHPEFADNFPEIYDWAIFKDYDMDGKNDIFTYSPGYGSMMVYKNVSDTELRFERVVYPYLTTLLPGGKVNLFVTNADYPGIYDIDNDGDLDILTFGVLGSFVDMHKNMSMEKYGNADSLDYEHTTYCWGNFAESDESNVLYFDTCRPSSDYRNVNGKDRHTGSTLLLHDFDDNGLVDLLLADVDYPGLFALYNNGTEDEAYIEYADTAFPGGWQKIRLFSMPAAAYCDIDNSGTKDLLVSPFDPGIITSENKNSCWYYKNEGQNNNPDFNIVKRDFLQGNMIDLGSGAYPLLYDWDNDGLKDLFVGNFGYYSYSYYVNYFLHSVYISKIAYFKNIGTVANPSFQLWDADFGGFSGMNANGLVPAIGDINNDGKADMLLGNADGKIIYAQNKGDNEFEIINKSFMDIDVGDFSTPQLFDIDNDGDNDLIIGEKAGNINFYEYENDMFVFVTDSLGKVNVTDYNLSWNGYSTPSFFRNNGDSTGLLVGSEQGKIFSFSNIDGNLGGRFTELENIDVLLDTSDVSYDRGMRSSAIMCNLIPDGKMEMIVGNYSGGLEYFNGVKTQVLSDVVDNKTEKNNLKLIPNPAKDIVRISMSGINNIELLKILNSSGQIVRELSYVLNSDIYIGDLPSGIYYVVGTDGKQCYTGKLVIMPSLK